MHSCAPKKKNPEYLDHSKVESIEKTREAEQSEIKSKQNLPPYKT